MCAQVCIIISWIQYISNIFIIAKCYLLDSCANAIPFGSISFAAGVDDCPESKWYFELKSSVSTTFEMCDLSMHMQ